MREQDMKIRGVMNEDRYGDNKKRRQGMHWMKTENKIRRKEDNGCKEGNKIISWKYMKTRDAMNEWR